MNNKKYFRLFDVPDISKHRQILMGIAIFSVMFSHWFGFQNIESGLAFKLSDIMVRLVFTQGMLFLSGFGLYYSFSKNHDICRFYKRRFIRLYVPFVILSLGLYVFFLCTRNDYSFCDFMAQITTVYFWYGGNFGGMWYVSVSIALYLFFPLLYKFVIRDTALRTFIYSLLFSIILFVMPYIIKTYNETYYDIVKIGISQIPYFVVGLFWGYITRNEVVSRKVYCVILLLLLLLFLSFTLLNMLVPQRYWIMASTTLSQKLFFMPLICIILNILDRRDVGNRIKKTFSWLGYYSLELYILHLHTYMFISYCNIFHILSPAAKASIAIITAIVLSVPINRLLTICTKIISK